MLTSAACSRNPADVRHREPSADAVDRDSESRTQDVRALLTR